MDKDKDLITLGKYVVIQRQNYTKLHKFNSITSCASLGKEQIELGNINQCKYFTTFKMLPKGKGRQRTYILEATDNFSSGIKDVLNIQESGIDNRNIVDDGKSQKLSKDEILSLKETTNSSADIVETLIMNSSTFNSKTEYSQEKYLKKKEKKYFEFLTIRKPTIWLIAEIMYRQDPGKVLGMRIDTLSQILTYSNVNSCGNHLLYESGTGGLLPAALLNSIGAKTSGCLVHTHPGNSAQKQGLFAMNFPEEQLNRCISVNVYSVLRHYYQDINEICEQIVAKKRKLENVEDEDIPSEKVLKIDEDSNGDKCKTVENEKCVEDMDVSMCSNSEGAEDSNRDLKNKPWMLDNEKACNILREKVDSLTIVAKEHPMSVFKALMPFVKISRPFIIYSQYQEPLQECYLDMRKMSNVVNIKMVSSWMRGYQVLENRTHPNVLMCANSGFLLTGWIVQS